MRLPIYYIDLILGESNKKNYLVKPNIVFGNYFFAWDKQTPGLYSNEFKEFGFFIKSLIPDLETAMNTLNTARNTNPKNAVINKSKFSVVKKFNNYVFFIFNFDYLGSSIFEREEFILFENESNSNNDVLKVNKDSDFPPSMSSLQSYQNYGNSISLKWKLGELLFNRIDNKDNN